LRALAVSTFYLLPPRPRLGQQFADFLKSYFPGIDWDAANWAELAEMVSAPTIGQPDTFVVFKEDLPEGVELERALIDDFGAQAGDEVVERRPHEVVRWRIAE
jgi:hypothetical protein